MLIHPLQLNDFLQPLLIINFLLIKNSMHYQINIWCTDWDVYVTPFFSIYSRPQTLSPNSLSSSSLYILQTTMDNCLIHLLKILIFLIMSLFMKHIFLVQPFSHILNRKLFLLSKFSHHMSSMLYLHLYFFRQQEIIEKKVANS